MKILIAGDTFYPDLNGCAYFTHRLALSLVERGHQVRVIAPSRTFRSEWSERRGVKVFGVWSLPTIHYADFRFCLPWFIQKPIARVMQEFKPDVVHVQGHFMVGRTVVKVAKEMKLKVMGTNHFMPENLLPYLHLPHRAEEWLKRLAWNDFRTIFETLDSVTSPTQTAVDLVKQYGFSAPIQALSNGIDLKRFRPGQNAATLKERYQLPNKPVMLYVGRLDTEKNVDLILRALAQVDPAVAPHFLIGGKGFETKRLKALAQTLGLNDRVTFAGFVPDEELPFLYNAADAFVIAGTAELQSLVTLEAMASGLPVIGVDAMALPELVHDQENGYSFPPGDEARLAQAIRDLFSDEEQRKKMGQKSLEIVQAHSIDKVMATFESLYRQML